MSSRKARKKAFGPQKKTAHRESPPDGLPHGFQPPPEKGIMSQCVFNLLFLPGIVKPRPEFLFNFKINYYY